MAGRAHRPQRRRDGGAVAGLLLLLSLVASGQPIPNDDVHVVFLTDCTSYSDWQTLGMVFSWRESGQVRGGGALPAAAAAGPARCQQQQQQLVVASPSSRLRARSSAVCCCRRHPRR